jgi:hypothetical protein
LHQQNENADEEGHQKQRKKAFKYVRINFFEMKHAYFFLKQQNYSKKFNNQVIKMRNYNKEKAGGMR